jgi:hypothetical protein
MSVIDSGTLRYGSETRKIGGYAKDFRQMTRAGEHVDYWTGEV